ncbi:ATP-binding protein [Paenibacillus sp. MMS20-IR301]|uniref:AAA family ATPase n=1 Tax=Paenibacillus sp. MMS20-IR301 TaxID=2895946 RepID=UPI0028E21124|nr:ATP-binding protein [Paenibacillus sp. MMS20-IR301]WNS41580.1 ATP-binding protein [Paenibacillus sp. MMS20-IR301]
MLLEFRVDNYKLFRNELVFSMIPAPKQRDLNFSILHDKLGSKTYKGLSSAVIYGSNAAGKTNVISAMEVFKSIILRGHIRNGEGRSNTNPATQLLELIPNLSAERNAPVSFSIKFIEESVAIEYFLSINLGSFMESSAKRKIVLERLCINEKMIFQRKNELIIESIETIEEYLVTGLRGNENSIMKLAQNNMNDEELFLINGFKAMFSSKLTSLITNWFENKLLVFCRADALQAIPIISDKQSIYIDKTINEATKLFGVSSNELAFASSEDDSEAKLYSLLNPRHGEKSAIPSVVFESYGTIRFVNLFPIIIRALLNGSTLVIDEFDASLHPMVLMSIINIFHNDEINKKNAQLIFNTHNPIFLNRNLFRRDEIKFVEREDGEYSSILYSLSDFGTSGKRAVRNSHDYMKNYFVSQYGAIKDIDFSSMFEGMWETGEEKAPL